MEWQMDQMYSEFHRTSSNIESLIKIVKHEMMPKGAAVNSNLPSLFSEPEPTTKAGADFTKSTDIGTTLNPP